MLDIQFIREHADAVKQAAKDKGVADVVDRLLTVNDTRVQLIADIQKVRTQRNALVKEIYGKPSDEVVAQGKKLKALLAKLEPDLRAIEQQYEELMLQIPNIPADEVPRGKDASGNQVVAKVGKKPTFDFTIKDHVQLCQDLDLVDFDRGVKVAGFRGYYLKGDGALLHLAVMNYALKKLITKGFIPVIPPIVLQGRPFVNTAHFPWGKPDVYQTFNDEKSADPRYLAGTAEVPLVSYHMDEVLREKDLPLLYAGYSQCYRREIGSHGKDTTGMYRIHEFTKIEQVILCKNDWEESQKWHENLRAYSEEMLQELGLHYQVLLMCTGDMGEPQVKKYDIETWMPGLKRYGETQSDSIMGEFQSRRANVKYQATDGTVKYVHMLNNTALASPRILIAILETYQLKNGSVKVPKVLQAYMGKKIISN